MPDREQILAALSYAANAGYWLAVSWHVVTALAIGAVAAGWRPSNRLAGALLAAPLASVSVMAWLSGNPFNGVLCAALAVALLVLATALGNTQPASAGARWSRIAGGALLAFGWAYPHFLDHSPAHYLFAAPLGTVPCPTLAAVCGVAVIGRGLANRAWSWTLAVVSGFYAVFGIIRLGVWIDAVLLAGAIVLVVSARRLRVTTPSANHAIA